MGNLSAIVVSPNLVPANASITIQSPDHYFASEIYQIENDEGVLIRRGKITDPAREFSLSVGGMPDGIYWLVMGNCRERFTIV